jgi:hypothetical protein
MIYLASVEVAPVANSLIGGRGTGALVYCFIPSESKKNAKKKLIQALEEDQYKLVNIEFIEPYNGLTWEDERDKITYDRLAKRAALNNNLIYGPFYTWEKKRSSKRSV